jgi:lipopolysaccharide exporter
LIILAVHDYFYLLLFTFQANTPAEISCKEIILKLFSRYSFWVHSISITLLQRLSTIFFGLVITIILFRFFKDDKSKMGLWALYSTIIGMVEMIKVGLLRNATIKFIHQPELAENRKEIQNASLMINIIFTCVVILLIVTCGKYLSQFLQVPQLYNLLLLSIPSLVLLILFNHCEIIQQAYMKYPPIFKATIVRQGLFFAGVVLLFFFFKSRFTLVTLILVQLFALGLATVSFLRDTRQFLSLTFAYNKKIISQLLHFGKYVFGTALFSNLSRYTDHFMTSAMSNPAMGPVYVSYYNAVSRLTNMIDVPSLAAADVLFPKNAQASGTAGNEKVKYYFERMCGTLLALVIPVSVFVFIFPKIIITIIAGKSYLAAVPILQVTILANILRPIFNQFGTTMDAIGKPRINFLVNTLTLSINIFIVYYCIKLSNDKMGAAYGTVITYILAFFIIYFTLKKTLNIKLRNILSYVRQAYIDLFKVVRNFMQLRKAA